MTSHDSMKANATPALSELARTLEKDLFAAHGPMMCGKALTAALGYPTNGAFRQAVARNTVPVAVFSIERRRGKFALSTEVALWLATQRQSASGVVERRTHQEKEVCPLHNCLLQDCCPLCGELIYPTFRSCLDNPFECLRCFAPLTRTVAVSTDRKDAKVADLILGNRRVVLNKSQASVSHRHMFSVLRPHMLKPSTPAVSRLYQRVAVWAEPCDCQWSRFKEDNMLIVPTHTRGDVDAADSFDTGLAAERVLIFLTQLCRGHEVSAIRLANRLGRWPLGLRLNSQATVIAAAIYKLAVAYDLVQEANTILELQLSSLTEKARACYGKKMVRYGDSEPTLPELDYRLMQLEMLGMFAWLLIWYRDHTPLSSVSWVDLPHAIEFAPSWHVTPNPSGLRVRIRARATEKSIGRLVKRYWKCDLTYVSEDPVGPDELWRSNRLDSLTREFVPRSSEKSLNPVQRRLKDLAWCPPSPQK